MHMTEKAAQLPLSGKKLTDEITDMGNLDFLRFNLRDSKGSFGNIAEQFEHAAAFALYVARKIGLRTAQNINLARHVSFLPLSWLAPSLTSLRMTLLVTLRGRLSNRTSR